MELKKDFSDGFIELVFGPRWTYIATVRGFLQNFFSITLSDSKWADVISMAASELLENAVKYASQDGTRISARHNSQEKTLEMLVENYSDKKNIEVLKKEIESVIKGDPEKIYLKKTQEAALRTDGVSQLGFARIRYESNAEIKLEINDDLVQIVLLFDLSESRSRHE